MSKEIVIEYFGDFQQCAGINPLALEEFVTIITSTVQLFCKPRYAASLSVEFSFYGFSYVQFVVH